MVKRAPSRAESGGSWCLNVPQRLRPSGTLSGLRYTLRYALRYTLPHTLHTPGPGEGRGRGGESARIDFVAMLEEREHPLRKLRTAVKYNPFHYLCDEVLVWMEVNFHNWGSKTRFSSLM